MGQRSGMLVVFSLVGMLLPSCTTGEAFRSLPAEPTPPPGLFAHRLTAPEIEIHWNCTRSDPAVLHLDGIARNADAKEVRFLELRLAGLDADNLLQYAETIPDIILHKREFSPFHLQLPIQRSEARIDLFYQYHLAAPADQSIPLSPPENQLTVRDVCPKAQYPSG